MKGSNNNASISLLLLLPSFVAKARIGIIMGRWAPRGGKWASSLFDPFYKAPSRNNQFRVVLLFLCFFSAFFLAGSRRNPGTMIDPCTQENDEPAERLYRDRGHRKLVVEVSHGLGNRLRALSSAAALARITNRQLYVVWVPDLHLNASLHDLFYVSNVQVIEESYLQCALSSHQYTVYDYLENPVEESRRPKVKTKVSKHIYIRTAYRVFGKKKTITTEQMTAVLSSLRPSPTVLRFVNQIEKLITAQTGQRIGGTVGVHIRMQGNLELDIPGISRLGALDVRSATSRMRDVAAQRQRCHFKHFVDSIRAREHSEPFQYTYIISSDSNEARDGMTQELGSRAFVPQLPEYKECMASPRGLLCVQLALAEMLILSRTSAFISSAQSSFSEVIEVLGGFHSDRLTSGCLGGKELLF